MTWTKLARVSLKFRDRYCVSIRIERKAQHLPRMFIYISRKVAMAAALSFAKGAKVSLLIGAGPDAGRLKVMQDADGEFCSHVRNKERPGVMIAAAAPEGFPPVWKGTRCEPEIGKGWVAFALPWHAEAKLQESLKLQASLDALERLSKEDDKAKYWMTPADAQGDDPPLPQPASAAGGEAGPQTMADIVREMAAKGETGEAGDAADAVRGVDGAAGPPAADDQPRGLADTGRKPVPAGAARGSPKRTHANKLMQAAAMPKPIERPPSPVKPGPKQTITFSANGAEVELFSKQHIVATRLFKAMGKGFLPFDVLTEAAGNITKEYLGVIVSELRRKLEPMGLAIEAVPRMGFVMKPLERTANASEAAE